MEKLKQFLSSSLFVYIILRLFAYVEHTLCGWDETNLAKSQGDGALPPSLLCFVF